MRLAYVTTYDATDRLQWSGSGSAILEALRAQGINVTPIGPLRRNFNLVGRIKRRLYGQFAGLDYDFERDSLAGWDYARQVSARLQAGRFDVVFSPGTIPVARLKCPQPIVTWADATFGSLIALYHRDRQLCAETLRAGHLTERVALENSALSIFASEWAAKSAIADYGASPDKVTVVPFGANFIEPPSFDRAMYSIEGRGFRKCELITIGVDWVRKGMSKAIELTTLLNARGVPARLTIVGCTPPIGTEMPPYVNVMGFVDKRTPEGERALTSIMERSHFHVLFSMAECFGIVFAEANAHALPNIASDVGGIESAVVNGRGGQRFDLSAPVSAVADYVQSCFRDPVVYAQVAKAARQEYDGRLNWLSAGAEVARQLRTLV